MLFWAQNLLCLRHISLQILLILFEFFGVRVSLEVLLDMLRASNMEFTRFRDHTRVEGLVICDLTLTRLRKAAGILNWSCIILLLLLGVTSELLTPSKFRVLFLLKEFLLRGIFALYGSLAAKLSVFLVHVVLLVTFEVSVGRGQALGRVVRKSPEI